MTLFVVFDYFVVKAKFHFAIQLATSSRAGLRPARELDSVMEFGLNSTHLCLADLAFWATVCKTVRPMLSDRCLSVPLSACPVCLCVCL